MRNRFSKIYGILVGVVVFVVVVGVLASVRPAQANMPVVITANAEQNIKQGIGGAFGAAFMSAMQYFINKVAYDSAVWLASGGKGQKPLMFDDPGKYFGDVAKDAAGEALANLNNLDFLRKAGINLCMPPDVNLSLRIKMDIAKGLFGEPANAPVPKCRWADVAKAYEKIGEPGYWSKVGIAFEPGQNDLSMYMAANNAIKEYSLKKETAARDDAANKGEMKAPTDSVSGKPTAPREVAKTEAAAKAPSEEKKKTEAEANALMPKILDGTLGAFVLGAKTFTNTLASQLMTRLTTRGFFSANDALCYMSNDHLNIVGKPCSNDVGSATSQGQFGGKTAAALAFADLLTPKIYSVNDYDGTLIAELGACDPAHRGLYSCAADGGLLAAVQQAKSGNMLTVKQAIEQGFLHKDWQLISPGSVADNQDPNCFTRAYCYANLAKLRQANILPVGWELAAMQSNFKQPYTLDFFVKNFNNKNTIAYHLIDPNWLIKLPPTQCKARVYGQFLVAEGTPNRAEYCADLATCVNEDADGGCSSGQYGYCRQIKNIWRLGGDECPAQFNTCTALVSRVGEATAYVANTISKGVCDAQNVGCRAYSNAQKFESAQGDWEWQGGSAQLAYFNKDAEACSADAEGCTRFIRQTESVRGQELNMRKAPDYYHCYDGNSIAFSSSTVKWPSNNTDLIKLANSLSAEEKQQCSRFARVCAAEENRCEAYTPTNGDPQVTGILSAGDLCPQECVGYENFIQQSSFFEPLPANPQTYFIPSTGDSCNADNAGCDEFVNIEQGGGEQKSFFTELHLCSKNSADGATYYTWEGSDTTGYQLKSYVMKKGLPIPTAANTNNQQIDDGKGEPPEYLGKEYDVKLKDYAARCNKIAYANRLVDKNFDTDCREFYDKDGHISYRLWSQTITVDPSACQKFRKSVAYGGKAVCEATYGAWEANTNTCIYLAIPGEANTCEAQFKGCRAYKGNGGNNYQIIDTSTFEQATLAPWSGGTLSAESTTQGGHSVKIAKKTKEKVLERTFANAGAPKGTTYLVSFWAKGTAGKKVIMGLYKDATADGASAPAAPNINSFALSNNWGVYTAGPFTIDWDKEDAALAFKPVDQSADVFVDTITVRKMQDMVYAVRNSWETPASCDNPLTDPAGTSAGGTADSPVATVPQAMLGCAAYTNRGGNTISAKSFTNICRAEAVGCEEMKDTYNAQNDAPLYSNAICALPKQGIAKKFFDEAGAMFPGSNPAITIEIQSVNSTNEGISCQDATGDILCTIQPGATFCRFNWSKGYLPTEGAKTTAVFKYGDKILKTDLDEKFVIKTDSQTQTTGGYTTAYLVNNSEYYCAADALGCTAYGQRVWVATSTLQVGGGVKADYATTYIKNDPAQYDKISCQPEAEGCEQYSTSKGGQTYFKDPNVWGNFTCEWRDNVEYGSAIYNGWFRTGAVGFCGLKGASPAGLANDKITQCTADSDCVKGQICNQPLPCYPQYIVEGMTFGIYRAGDSGYNKITNPVGQCGAQYDSCSEFVDPQDTSPIQPKGKLYYMLDNAKLDKSSCGGQVSKEQSCVLFDKTSEVNYKPWKAKETYDASATAGGALVKPVEAGGAGGDANTILKVKRDRVCGEWLTCGSSQDVFDQNTAKTIKQCLSLQSCMKPAGTSASGVGSVGNCGEYGKFMDAQDAFKANTVSTVEKYQSRDIGFAAAEFTGHSIPLSYPMEFYKPVLLKDSKNISLAFAYCPPGWLNCEEKSKNFDFTMCKVIEKECGSISSLGFENLSLSGECDMNHRCAIKESQQKSTLIGTPLECRGYPAGDAPFSFNKKTAQSDPKQDARPLKYKDANNCIIGQNCECSYNVALYGDPNKGQEQKKGFFAQGMPAPGYICSGGDNDGGEPLEETKELKCVPAKNKSCVEIGGKIFLCKGGGTPIPQFKFDNQYVGWQDYCLEYDTSQVLYYKDKNPVYPCLTWYPVDKAPGAVDIYAQHKEAGYALAANKYYCAAGETMLAKVPTRERCVGIKDLTCFTSDYKKCLEAAAEKCPAGYFAVVDTCDNGGSCDKSIGVTDILSGGITIEGDKCPYRCIPNDSVFSAETKENEYGQINNTKIDGKVGKFKKCYDALVELSKGGSYSNSLKKEGDTIRAISLNGTNFSIDDKDKENKLLIDFMSQCITYGVKKSDVPSNMPYKTFNACRAIAQTSDQSTDGTQNKAWTDRLQDEKFVLPAVNSDGSKFTYPFDIKDSSSDQPFGATQLPEENSSMPVVFPVCVGGDQISLPDPITFKCLGELKLTNESRQARPYQFEGVLNKFCAKTNSYVCLYGDEKSSPVKDEYNILSQAGVNFCSKSKLDQKQCFDSLLSNVKCESNKEKNGLCFLFKEKDGGDDYSTAKNDFKGGACKENKDCVKSAQQYNAIKCVVPGGFCKAIDVKFFKAGMWENVICKEDKDCNVYASNLVKEMCVEEGQINYCVGSTPLQDIKTNFEMGVLRIQNIFAKVMKMWKWVFPLPGAPSSDRGGYEEQAWNKTDFGDQDRSFDLAKLSAGGLPPQLHPVDGQKEGAEVKDVGQGFSVNGVYATLNAQGKPSGPAYLVQEGQILATLSFYGFADKNHMPLRRIAIDWGDGTDVVGDDGGKGPVNYYKNKRGKCDTSEQGAGGGWAGNELACTSGEPFSYQHTYLYKEAVQDSKHCGNASVKLSAELNDLQKQFTIGPNTQVCVYQPKAQLLDNWGWCNANGTGGNAGCWDFKNGVFGCYGDGNDQDFCLLKSSFSIPWTSFAGKIIVLPTKQ